MISKSKHCHDKNAQDDRKRHWKLYFELKNQEVKADGVGMGGIRLSDPENKTTQL